MHRVSSADNEQSDLLANLLAATHCTAPALSNRPGLFVGRDGWGQPSAIHWRADFNVGRVVGAGGTAPSNGIHDRAATDALVLHMRDVPTFGKCL